jgi:pimeloyl-ACP methyl ester carboxylesterase
MHLPKSKTGKYSLFAIFFIFAIVVIGGIAFYLQPFRVMSYFAFPMLRMNGFESKYVQTDSYKMFYWVGGEGEPLIMIYGPGLGQSGMAYTSLMPELARKYRVYAVDLPGFGKSEKPDDVDYSLEFHAHQIKNFLESQGISRATFLSHSLGSSMTLKFTTLWPEKVDRLIFVGAMALGKYDPQYFKGKYLLGVPIFVKLLAEPEDIKIEDMHELARMVNEPAPPDFMLQDMLRYFRRDSRIAKLTINLIKNEKWLNGDIKNINIPVLLIWGKQDFSQPLEVANAAHRDFPDSRLIIFDKCSVSIMDECTERVLPEIQKFLAGDSYPAGSTIEIPAPGNE